MNKVINYLGLKVAIVRKVNAKKIIVFVLLMEINAINIANAKIVKIMINYGDNIYFIVFNYYFNKII